jgi:hypothetical protein
MLPFNATQTNFTLVAQEIYKTAQMPLIEDLIKNVCAQWDNKTILSHNVYMKLIMVAGALHLIKQFWDPHPYFKVEGTNIAWIDCRKEGLISFFEKVVILCMILLIIDTFYISYFMANKHNLWDFLTLMWNQPIIVR